MSNLNVISNWYGRLGNNIQQICNGILFSSLNGDGFVSIEHELINQVVFNYNEQSTIKQCRFFHLPKV